MHSVPIRGEGRELHFENGVTISQRKRVSMRRSMAAVLICAVQDTMDADCYYTMPQRGPITVEFLVDCVQEIAARLCCIGQSNSWRQGAQALMENRERAMTPTAMGSRALGRPVWIDKVKLPRMDMLAGVLFCDRQDGRRMHVIAVIKRTGIPTKWTLDSRLSRHLRRISAT